MKKEPEFTDKVIAHNGHVIRGKVQQRCYRTIMAMKEAGATRGEIARGMGNDGGGVSSALNSLQKAGVIMQLENRRTGHHIYVAPEFVNGRILRPLREFHCKCCRFNQTYKDGPERPEESPKKFGPYGEQGEIPFE